MKKIYTTKQPDTYQELNDYYNLRWRILREPWNQPEGSEKDELEDESFHIMICADTNLVIGIGRIHFNSKTEAQIRYMAVEKARERQNIGTSIIKALENHAMKNNCTSIILNAREPVVGFYEKSGYEIIEKSHLLFDCIQHFKMLKNI